MAEYSIETGTKLGAVDPFSTLDSKPTINGAVRTPHFVYKGIRVNFSGAAGSWVWAPTISAETLDETGSGTTPLIVDGGVLLVDNYFAGSTNSFANISTDDPIIEFIGRSPKGSTSIERGLIYKPPAATNRMYLFRGTDGKIGFQLGSAGGGPIVKSAGVVPADTPIHVIAYVNKDEASAWGSRLWVNGVPGVGVDFSALAATAIDPNLPLQLGNGSVSAHNNVIGYCALWSSNGMIPAGQAGYAMVEAMVAERFAKIPYPLRVR